MTSRKPVRPRTTAVMRVAPMTVASRPTMRTSQSSAFGPVIASKLPRWTRGHSPVSA
jgi:hypothetical protein